MEKCLGIFAALVLVGTTPAWGQDVVVRGSVDKTTVGMAERLFFSLHIEGASPSDVRTPPPPQAQGLTLLQRTPNTQRNMSIVNGRLEQSIAFRWSFRPVQEGTARIDAVAVTVGERRYTTEPITIDVVDQARRPSQQGSGRQVPLMVPSRPQTEETDEEFGDRDLFIRAVPSSRTAWQNEQVTVEYQLFFRDGIQLRHSRLAGSWDAEGFWREEFNVDARPVPRRVVENGLLYHTIVLKRVAVFPTRPGTLTIAPLEIESEAYVPSGASDLFERFFSMRGGFETVDLSSPPVRLAVEPLPSDAPAAFAGAVGTYALEAAVDETSVEVGEPLQLTVTVRGSGNIATLDAPQFDAPGIFERYEPDVDVTIDRDGQQVRGRKTFRYVLVPRSNGRFELPPVTLSYFDPDRDRYVTTEAALPAVRVTGSAAPLAAGTTSEGLPVDDIAAILTDGGSWHALDGKPLYRRAWPYAAMVLPIGILLLLRAYQRRADRLAHDRRFARGRLAHPLARKHLNEARKLLAGGPPQAFYEEIERAVSGFVGNRLNIPETGLTRDQLDDRLRDVGLAADRRAELRDLLDECDQARFAPVRPGRKAMESAQQRAALLIIAVDEAVGTHRAETAAA